MLAARRWSRSGRGSPSARTSLGCPLPRSRVRRGSAPGVEQLEARLRPTSTVASTGLGPHLDDILVTSGDRDLRRFGSQGEQRLAVLSLLLAEAELLPVRPLLLGSTTCSRSFRHAGRRRTLGARIAEAGQTVVTATEAVGAAVRGRRRSFSGAWLCAW